MAENQNEKRIIDETNYQQMIPAQRGPAAVGRGGDPLFKNIYAPKEQIQELLEETMIVQDWVQKETCNNVALTLLNKENLKDMYYKIKDGFGEYGPIVLMGYKTPQGVEIPRLKVMNTDGEVLNIITGPMVLDEIIKRVDAYKELFDNTNYEQIEDSEAAVAIEDYSGNPDDYV